MKSSTFLASSVLLSSAGALKVVKFPLEKKSSSGLSKRDTIKAELINQVQNYALNVSIGTPAQDLTLYLDTGSSDLWVNVATSSYCSASDNPCIGGFFDPSSSSTYEVAIPNGFDIQYGDNTTAAGDYSSDTVTIGGISVTNQTFGVALNNTGNPEGLLGVGFDTDEAYCNLNQSQGLPCDGAYKNFVSNLAIQGKINSRAYSLWLDTNTSSTGYLLFGGVDSAYYTGDLIAMPMIPDDTLTSSDGTPYYRELQVAVYDIALNNATLIEGFEPIRAVLDSGTTFSKIPQAAMDALQQQLGLSQTSDGAVYLANCSLAESSDELVYTFGSADGGAVIRVPFSELVGSPTGDTLPGGGDACVFGVGTQSAADQMILGDTFLRSAYVVYDLDNLEIAMAQANWNPGTSDVQEIPSGGVNAAIPGVTATVSGPAPTNTAGETGTAYSVAPSGTPTSSASASSSSGSSSSSNAANMQVKAPGMTGLIAVAVILLGTAAGAFSL